MTIWNAVALAALFCLFFILGAICAVFMIYVAITKTLKDALSKPLFSKKDLTKENPDGIN